MEYMVLTALNGETQAHRLIALSKTAAIWTALEHAGPGAILLSCLREGDW